MRLSNSKVKTWRRCPNQYRYKYMMKLEPKKKGLPLTRGDWLHQMLMHHYDGESWQDIHKELTKEFYASTFEEQREELGDLPGETKRIMKSYERKWAKEDKRYVVVDSELDEIITLPNGDKFNFIIDLIVEDIKTRMLWLWDHKSVTSFMPPDFMLLDAQLARYFWSATKMGYTPLAGVLFNEIRTKPPAVPEVLKSGQLSQRKNMDTDYFTYMREIKKHGLNPDHYEETLIRLKRNTGKFFRRTPMPKDKPLMKQQMMEMMWSAREMKAAESKNEFPRTPKKDCTWDCSYKDICIVELMGGDIKPMIKKDFNIRARNPEG